MARFTSTGGGSGAGAPGPQGPQGEQGSNGTNGLDGEGFNFRGEWVDDTFYSKNDIVTQNGSTYIANYDYQDTMGPWLDGDLWAPLALKGEPGLNGDPLDFLTVPSNVVPTDSNTYTLGTPDHRWADIYIGPNTINITDTSTGANAALTVTDGVLLIDGANQLQVGQLKFVDNTIESTTGDTNIQIGLLTSNADVIVNRDLILGDGKTLTFPDNTVQTTASVNADWDATSGLAQILNKPDIEALTNITSVRYSPVFSATGLTFTGTGATYPTYNSYYVKQGQLVSFWIAVDCSTVTSFGTGQLNLQLPFAPLPGTMNHFSGWVFVDETANPDLAGHIIVNADHLPNTQTLDLHYIKSAGGANSAVMEAMLRQNTPVVLTTATNIYVNGTYISA